MKHLEFVILLFGTRGSEVQILAWIYDGAQIGHSGVNQIKVGEEAYFHLHLWRPDLRKAGLGIQFCRKSIALYFDRLRLQRLWCEPFAGNPAPNRTVRKLGFEFVKQYRTVPGQPPSSRMSICIDLSCRIRDEAESRRCACYCTTRLSGWSTKINSFPFPLMLVNPRCSAL